MTPEAYQDGFEDGLRAGLRQAWMMITAYVDRLKKEVDEDKPGNGDGTLLGAYIGAHGSAGMIMDRLKELEKNPERGYYGIDENRDHDT